MRIFLKLLLLFASIFLVAYVARVTFVPDAMPIADGEQPGWQVQVASLLASVQNLGLIGMALVTLVPVQKPGRAINAQRVVTAAHCIQVHHNSTVTSQSATATAKVASLGAANLG